MLRLSSAGGWGCLRLIRNGVIRACGALGLFYDNFPAVEDIDASLWSGDAAALEVVPNVVVSGGGRNLEFVYACCEYSAIEGDFVQGEEYSAKSLCEGEADVGFLDGLNEE